MASAEVPGTTNPSSEGPLLTALPPSSGNIIPAVTSTDPEGFTPGAEPTTTMTTTGKPIAFGGNPLPGQATTSTQSSDATPTVDPLSIVDITFNGYAYQLPSTGQGSINLLQLDGSTVTVSPGQIIVSGDTIPIDTSIATPMELTAKNGIKFQVSPGALTPAGSGLNPLSSAFQLFKDVAGDFAKDAASNINTITSQVSKWVDGGSDDLLTGLNDIFQNTVDNVLIGLLRNIPKVYLLPAS
jgi:hypothetical protein